MALLTGRVDGKLICKATLETRHIVLQMIYFLCDLDQFPKLGQRRVGLESCVILHIHGTLVSTYFPFIKAQMNDLEKTCIRSHPALKLSTFLGFRVLHVKAILVVFQVAVKKVHRFPLVSVQDKWTCHIHWLQPCCSRVFWPPDCAFPARHTNLSLSTHVAGWFVLIPSGS